MKKYLLFCSLLAFVKLVFSQSPPKPYGALPTAVKAYTNTGELLPPEKVCPALFSHVFLYKTYLPDTRTQN